MAKYTLCKLSALQSPLSSESAAYVDIIRPDYDIIKVYMTYFSDVFS